MTSKLFHRLGLSTTLLYRKDCLLRSKKKSFLSRLEEGQVSVRLANANDYDEILELSQNIKDTFDYFPFRFHKWLAEPDKIAVQGVQNSFQKHKIRDKELLDYDFLTYKVDPEQVNFEHKLQHCSKLRPCPKEEFEKRFWKTLLLAHYFLIIFWLLTGSRLKPSHLTSGTSHKTEIDTLSIRQMVVRASCTHRLSVWEDLCRLCAVWCGRRLSTLRIQSFVSPTWSINWWVPTKLPKETSYSARIKILPSPSIAEKSLTTFQVLRG